VGLYSKPFVHFVIQAPNLVNCTLICCEHFQILGQLNFSLYVCHIGFQNGIHLKFTFAIIYGHNDTIDLILVSKCMFLGVMESNEMIPTTNWYPNLNCLRLKTGVAKEEKTTPVLLLCNRSGTRTAGSSVCAFCQTGIVNDVPRCSDTACPLVPRTGSHSLC